MKIRNRNIKDLKPGMSVKMPDHFNRFDVIHHYASKYNALVDPDYDYKTGKWTLTKVQKTPLSNEQRVQLYKIDAGIPEIEDV